MSDKPQTIIGLKQSNMMGIKFVELELDGSLYIVGGKNGAGKSSLVRNAVMALGGKKEWPDKAIRAGAKKGYSIVETEDFELIVKVNASGNYTYQVKAKDGSDCGTPQELRDRMLSALTLNPLKFKDMSPAERVDLVKSIGGVDTAEIDERGKRLYEDRKIQNREVARLKGAMESAPHHADAPGEEVSIGELVAELQRRRDENERKRQARLELAQMRETTINLKKRLAEIQEALKESIEVGKKQAALVAELGDDEDWQEIKDKIDSLETDNQKARDNAEHGQLVAAWKAAAEKSEAMTQELDALKTEREELVASAKMPIDGLELADGDVLLDGVPFGQVNTRRQIEASTAIEFSLNKQLKTMFIARGSDIDTNGLGVLAKMAGDNGWRIIMERVGEGGECTIILEDGEVKET